MFCPNCGKDCGDANFCSDCGTRLHQKQENENLPKRTNTKNGSANIPTNSCYIGIRSTYLDLSDHSVIVSPLQGYRSRIEIPYDQLCTVIYLRPDSSGWIKRDGALLFRGENNKYVPVPDFRQIPTDNSSVFFSADKDTLFYHVFQMLKSVAPSNADFKMIIPETKIKNLDDIAQRIDLDYFWNMYAPHRERATSGICAKYGIKPAEAKALVDRLFDERQRILYEADPIDAIRDLNLVVTNKNRQTISHQQQEAQRNLRHKQDELKESIDYIGWKMHMNDLSDDK
jgi:hypothetical protein